MDAFENDLTDTEPLLPDDGTDYVGSPFHNDLIPLSALQPTKPVSVTSDSGENYSGTEKPAKSLKRKLVDSRVGAVKEKASYPSGNGISEEALGLAPYKEQEILRRPSDRVRAKAVELLERTKLPLKCCLEIEDCLMKKFETTNAKEYKAKLRTLKFNLSKNKDLRVDLEEKIVTAEEVITYSPDQLSNREQKAKRVKAQEDIFNASRTDWLDVNREKMNKLAGIKNQRGLFTCRRCKSSKTTHYQKQTRCADEPMTVFVQCTECGNRWRC